MDPTLAPIPAKLNHLSGRMRHPTSPDARAVDSRTRCVYLRSACDKEQRERPGCRKEQRERPGWGGRAQRGSAANRSMSVFDPDAMMRSWSETTVDASA